NSIDTQYYKFLDENPGNGEIKYRLKQINLDGTFKYSDEITVNITPPLTFSLSQNYQNPFNPVTRINFSLPEKSKVQLKIYDMLGKHVSDVIDDEKSAGVYNIDFHADDLSSGIYFYILQAGDFNEVRKMILMK